MEDSRTTAARTHFDRWSATYESGPGARRLQSVQTAALAALALTPDDVLLDLGCGTGAAVREAAPAVRRAVGFDLSPAMIAQARELAADLANVEFREGDVSGPLPFADGEFTAIVCTTAFHHFPSRWTRSPRCPACSRPRPARDRRRQPPAPGRVRARPRAAGSSAATSAFAARAS